MYHKQKPILVDSGAAYLSNLDIAGRRTSILFILFLLLMGFAAATAYIPCQGKSNSAVFIPQLLCIFAILLVWGGRKFLALPPRNILSPDVIFVSMFCVFHFGYITLYASHLADWDDEVFWAPEKTLKAVLFCIWCLILFLIGYELPGNRYSRKPIDSQITPCSHLCLLAGKIFIVVTILFFWGVLFASGIRNLLSDYQLLIKVGGLTAWGRFFWLAHDLGVIGIVLYCTTSAILYRKAMSGILFFCLSWFYMFSILLLGDRGGFIQVAIIPIVVFHYFQRKIKFYWILGIGLVLFFIMTVIGITRTLAVLDVKQIAQEYQYVQQEEQVNPITRAFLEFGSSIKTVDIAMTLVPEQHPYWYGKSYVDGLFLLIPNIIPGFIRTQENSVGAWVTETAFGSLQSTHGRGGSIAMEAYLNFGFLGGAVFFVFLGYGYRVLYERVLCKPTFLRIAVFLGFTAGLVLWMRNTANVFYRPFVWTFLAAWIIYSFQKGTPYEIFYSDTEGESAEQLDSKTSGVLSGDFYETI